MTAKPDNNIWKPKPVILLVRNVGLCLLIVLTASTSAWAASWVYLIGSDNGSKYFYDAESIVTSGDTVRVWVRGDHSADRTKSYRESKALWKYNCAQRTTVTLSDVEYAATGRIVYSHNNPDIEVLYEPVVPETVGEAAMKAVCEK